MDLIEKSLQIALQAYAGKKDKAGKTYLLHPLRLMSKMNTEEAMAVALLHDVIEDSDYNKAQLLAEGIPEAVAEAVQVMTKKSGESYQQFIDRVLHNEMAARVKKADIEDNINILRLNSLDQSDLERVAKYHAAWQRLNNQCKEPVSSVPATPSR